ncbi:ThiF family adenylyltransferase [Sporomusa carbonis]|uniref:ThiF family adenylyltransferase n=1 Tax=Sporomusa carbonis TaxID=3076075 RepID=UPI003C7A527E
MVDLSNLQRQVIHFTQDVGKPKVISGKETINAMNPDVNVVTSGNESTPKTSLISSRIKIKRASQ